MAAHRPKIYEPAKQVAVRPSARRARRVDLVLGAAVTISDRGYEPRPVAPFFRYETLLKASVAAMRRWEKRPDSLPPSFVLERYRLLDL